MPQRQQVGFVVVEERRGQASPPAKVHSPFLTTGDLLTINIAQTPSSLLLLLLTNNPDPFYSCKK